MSGMILMDAFERGERMLELSFNVDLFLCMVHYSERTSECQLCEIWTHV